jgi:hypothetical protein
MRRGERVINSHVFAVWEGNNWQDESAPALWYWQYRGPRNGQHPLNLDMGKGVTESDCIADIKAQIEKVNSIRTSMRW